MFFALRNGGRLAYKVIFASLLMMGGGEAFSQSSPDCSFFCSGKLDSGVINERRG